MFEWFKGRTLASALNAPRTVRVKGVRFQIQKITVMNYMDGSKVLKQTFDTYRTEKDSQVIEQNWPKVKSYYIDVLMAGVVWPELSRKQGEGDFFVEDLFKDMDMVNELVERIYEYTYGKKKFKSIVSQGLKLSKSTP